MHGTRDWPRRDGGGQAEGEAVSEVRGEGLALADLAHPVLPEQTQELGQGSLGVGGTEEGLAHARSVATQGLPAQQPDMVQGQPLAPDARVPDGVLP